MIRTIKLYGSMSDNFTETIQLDVDSGDQIVVAFRSIFKGYREFERENPELVVLVSDEDAQNIKQVGGATFRGELGNIPEVHMLIPQDGAFIAALAMIAKAAVVASAKSMLIKTLATVAISAIAAALAPSPKTGSGSPNQVAEKQSFLFNGAINVQEQGGAVPIVYGYFMVGSTVVSVSIDIDQLLTIPSRAELPSTNSPEPATNNPPVTDWQWAT